MAQRARRHTKPPETESSKTWGLEKEKPIEAEEDQLETFEKGSSMKQETLEKGCSMQQETLRKGIQ